MKKRSRFVRDGNVLLNVGPDPNGVIPPSHIQRLRQIGTWMNEHAESIYGTRGGPFQPAENYGSTYKGNKIYVHVRQWPQDGPIQLPVLTQQVLSSSVLTGGKADVQQKENGIFIDVKQVHRELLDTVVVLEMDGPITGIITP
jgi:alpha-L-fucosidase